jgi:hypothetical protein
MSELAKGSWFGRLLAGFIDWRARRQAKLKKRRDDGIRRMVAKEMARERRRRPQPRQQQRK